MLVGVATQYSVGFTPETGDVLGITATDAAALGFTDLVYELQRALAVEIESNEPEILLGD